MMIRDKREVILNRRRFRLRCLISVIGKLILLNLISQVLRVLERYTFTFRYIISFYVSIFSFAGQSLLNLSSSQMSYPLLLVVMIV